MKANVLKNKVPQPKMLFECDPAKNIYCSKKECYLNGGKCHATTKVELARHPITKAKMVVPMSNEEALELVQNEADKATLQAAIDEHAAAKQEEVNDIAEAAN